ncbi:MAG: hypothetical protein CM1200mP30_09410 [Pseudomonadota bacterium]|nr:MAG: hypothetical protein CM1200mP30_09410 [Pseudomonadota bacterium]
MSEFQNQKALVLQNYENLEAANAESVEEVISKFNSTELHWYGVYPFNEQHGVPAVAEGSGSRFLNRGQMSSEDRIFSWLAQMSSIIPTG